MDGLGQGLVGCGGVMSVCVMSLDSLCLWQVHVSVYCARRIPAHLRCTQCSIMLHLIDIGFLTCICLWQISRRGTIWLNPFATVSFNVCSAVTVECYVLY